METTANKARKGNRMGARQAITVKEYDHKTFGAIRGAEIKGEPWFVGVDLATALGYKRPADAIWRLVPEKHKHLMRLDETNGSSVFYRQTPDAGGNPHQMMVSEAGMYRLIFHSKLKAADDFVEWVTAEVLPSIRKTGSYSLKPETVALIGERTDAELTKALVQYDNRVKGRAKQKATIARKKAAAYWTDAQILVAISRVISAKLCGRDFARGTNTMYDVIENECGVPLHKRQEYWERGLGTSITAYTRRLYTFIVPEEMPAVLAGLSAWCAERGLDISEIVSKRQGRLVA